MAIYTFEYIEGQTWGEITLPAGLSRYLSYIMNNYGNMLADETKGGYASSGDVIDPTHNFHW